MSAMIQVTRVVIIFLFVGLIFPGMVLNANEGMTSPQMISLANSHRATDPVTLTVKDGHLLISYFWQINDFRLKFEEGDITSKDENSDFVKAYLKVLDDYQRAIKRVSRRIIKRFKLDDPVFVTFSEFYKSQPIFLKEAIDPAVKNILANYKMITPKYNTNEFLSAYFPGYGYGDPGFRYRKGHELSREFLYARWMEEEKTISESKIIELVVEVSLVAGILSKYPEARVGKAFPINFSGKIVMAVKVTWSNSTTIVTRTKKKIGHYKVWFELFKAKSSWGSPNWELCGKTYELLEEATGEEVATALEFKDN